MCKKTVACDRMWRIWYRKDPHLLRLQDEIRSGMYGDGAVAVYLGNLGISIRRFYEKFIESFSPYGSDFQDIIAALPPVEPAESVDQAYKKERLRDNVIATYKKSSPTNICSVPIGL